MPRWAKVVLWVVVFALCAAAGAWLASRTDPFPPGVEDPGARPTTEVSTTPSVAPVPIWSGAIVATTEHRLHVGGSCRSDWHGTYRVRLLPDGTLRHVSGAVLLFPGTAGCDFPQTQIQTEAVTLEVVGMWEARGGDVVVRMRFEERGRDPEGSLDVGALLATIERVQPEIRSDPRRPREGRLETPIRVELADGNQGTYVATYRVSANCRSGCG